MRFSLAGGLFVLAALFSATVSAQPNYGPSPTPGWGPPPPGYGPPPAYPPGYAAPPPKTKETPAGLIGGSTAGFRASRLDADITGADDSYGFLASGAGVAIASVKFLTMRFGIDAHIGGGSEDLEARIASHLTFGVIGHWAQTHGMFIRVGLGGAYEGNGHYLFSHFDLPLGEGGFQLHSDGFGLEVGARGGATLTGRLGVAPSGNRGFGVVGRWGGYATLAVATNQGMHPGAWLDAEFMRLEDRLPVHVGSARLCGGFLVFGCVDGRVMQSQLPAAGTDAFDDTVILYAGATLGIGAAFAADGISAFTSF